MTKIYIETFPRRKYKSMNVNTLYILHSYIWVLSGIVPKEHIILGLIYSQIWNKVWGKVT